MNWRIWAFLYGLYIWFQATLTIRFFPNEIFKPDDPLFMVAVFAFSGLAVYAAAWVFFRLFDLGIRHRFEAVALICGAGLFADIGVAIYIRDVFPAMDPRAHGWFAAWVFWGYAVGLMTPFWPRRAFGLLNDKD